MAQVLEVCEKDFRAVVENSAKPVVVCFLVMWSSPCAAIRTELNNLSAASEDYIVVQTDVDENNNLAERFGISNVPCTVLFENGEPKKRVEGFRTAGQLSKLFFG